MILSENRRSFYLFVLFVIFAGSFLISIVPDFFSHNEYLVNHQMHSVLEALGAMTAISMSLLLLQLHFDGKRGKGEYFLLSMGFLSMGILDTFVAISSTGQGLNLLHSLRSILGSIWFILVWFPGFGLQVAKIRSMAWMVACASILIGFGTLHFRKYLPKMVQNGEFTFFALGINSLTVVIFTVVAVYFFLEFLRSSWTESYLFTCVFMLLGLSSYESRLSGNWTEDWWFWHIQRFLAYAVVAYYIFRTFLRVNNELKMMNEGLEKQIAERTAQLSLEVAERTRYGAERDTMIGELQDAANRINKLTGLLPTCASCRMVRDAEGNWQSMETYIQDNSEARFSHGICPACTKKLYPDFYEKMMRENPPPNYKI
ncbi:MAG: hypothetical protein V2B20_16825 [Pseudomonadota bacterium]